MGNLEWILFVGFFALGYGIYRIELICRAQLKMLEQIGRLLDK